MALETMEAIPYWRRLQASVAAVAHGTFTLEAQAAQVAAEAVTARGILAEPGPAGKDFLEAPRLEQTKQVGVVVLERPETRMELRKVVMA
jgi:hypothetical protein